MKATEMTEEEALELQREMEQWTGSSWFIGKPVTKKSFAATHPNTSQSSKPEYEDDQQVLHEANERFLRELARKNMREYREEQAKKVRETSKE